MLNHYKDESEREYRRLLDWSLPGITVWSCWHVEAVCSQGIMRIITADHTEKKKKSKSSSNIVSWKLTWVFKNIITQTCVIKDTRKQWNVIFFLNLSALNEQIIITSFIHSWIQVTIYYIA